MYLHCSSIIAKSNAGIQVVVTTGGFEISLKPWVFSDTPVRATKNLQNSEFSEGRLFDKIEWGPPLKTEKLLWVMKKTEKARIEWGGSHSILATGARRNPELRGSSHSILATGARRNPELRGGSHSILSKRRPLRGGSHSILAKRRNPEYPEKWNFLSLNSVPAYNSVVHLVIFWCVW